ncbi:MAG: TonB-dependent receptor, partial [Leptolyngbya sp. SIO3F4]|nr:TonB-dependent receptor [Leptolyngbya sp. SIO3F4]
MALIRTLVLYVLATVSLIAISSQMAHAQKAKYTISGQIRDAENGEDIPLANVLVTNLPGVGTTSNVYGFYSITLEEGEYTLSFQLIGYESVQKQVVLTQDQRLDIEIGKGTQELQEVVISSEKEDQNITRNEGSVTQINMKEVQEIAVFGGEPDIIKVMEFNPGIKSAGEGNAGFYVRGGGLDQNLILLDEAPVYNPSHLLGFFSVFNGDAIKGATVYKGGMPAEYGGRTSSVMDIRMKDGNNKNFGASGGIGLLSGRLTVEGPIVKDRGSFIVSGRRTYLDLFLGLSDDESLSGTELFFYDLNVKANYRINDKNRVYLSGYFGRDRFGFSDQFGLNWGNATATLRWNHLFSDKLFSNTSFIYSDYDYEFSFGEGQDELGLQSVIHDLNFKQDFTLYLNNKNTMKFGFNAINHTIEPGNLNAGSNTGITAQDAEEKRGLEGAVYIQNQQDVTPRLNINYGLRYSFYQQYGTGTEYTFTDAGELISTETFSDWEAMEF